MKDKRNWKEEERKAIQKIIERRARMSPEELEQHDKELLEQKWPYLGARHLEDEEE